MDATHFRSANLIYRAVEDNEADATFIHSIFSEPISTANAGVRLVKPEPYVSSAAFAKKLSTSFLGVLICRPADPNPVDTEVATDSKPKPIGFLHFWHSTGQEHHRDAMLGLQLLTAEQGKGCGTEAIKWALEWAFLNAGLHRVSIGYSDWNEGAGRLYRKLGFVEEGRSREARWYRGEYRDSVQLGMLEGEWRDVRKAEEENGGGRKGGS